MKWLIRQFTRLLIACCWHSRVIPDRLNENNKYLTRWYLLGGEKHRFFTICVHTFHCSDPTDLHDHPFSYFTIVLSGGYWEHTPKGKFWRRPGHFRFNFAKSKHRIELDPHVKEPVTTLFFMGPRTRDWGFWMRDKFVPHDRYLRGIKLRKKRQEWLSSSTSRQMGFLKK